MKIVHVDGKETVKIMLYALSTCGWCRKTKALLDELGLAYDYVFIDQLILSDADIARAEIMQWNPNCSFPTIVIDGKECVIGFQEEKIRSLAER